MAQKTIFLLAACIGLMLVAALMFSGTDPEQAARSGPRWRRYLIAAALLVLAALGMRYVLQDRSRDGTPPEVTCYSMPVSPTRPALTTRELLSRLQRGMEQLDRMVAQKKLDPQTVVVRLEGIEKELAELCKADAAPALTAQELELATNLRAEALGKVAKLRGRLTALLEESEDWKAVVSFWRHCGSLPTGQPGKGHSLDRRTVNDIDARLKEANAALERLCQSGLLQPQEQQLLAGEAQRLRDEICVPILIATTCYDSIEMPPEHVSLRRLSERIVLLKALLSSGKVHPYVVERLLPSLEQDLKTLAAAEIPPAQLQPGGPDPKKVEQEARELINQLKEAKPPAGLEQPR